jgi:hypothetical protein
MKMTGEGRAIGRALSDYEQGRDKVLMIVDNGFQKLDITGNAATTTGMLTIGNVDLNANAVAIINVKSLASANGTWSIDENGRIVAKQLCLEDLCIDKTTLTNILQVAGQAGMVLGASTSTSTGTGSGDGSGATTGTASSTGTGGDTASSTPTEGTGDGTASSTPPTDPDPVISQAPAEDPVPQTEPVPPVDPVVEPAPNP